VTYKRQTRPLVREGAPQRQDNKFQAQTSTKWARHQDILTDILTASRKVTLTLTIANMFSFNHVLYVAYLCYCIVTQAPYQVTLVNTKEHGVRRQGYNTCFKGCPISPMSCNEQAINLSVYIPLLSYLLFLSWFDCKYFCVVGRF
jgi:hypothetical protein